MSRLQRRSRVAGALLAVALVFGSTACAPASSPAQDEIPQVANPSADSEPGTEPDTEPGTTPDVTVVDPVQETRRTGPSVSIGGPPNGGQGLDDLGDGRWCEGVALFWGGEGVPEGVSFTVEGITSEPEGIVLADDQEICGQSGADRECIGLTFAHDAGTVFCSVVVQPTDRFANGTVIALTGTLECLTNDICDAVETREVEQGPPILICDPAFLAAGNECAAPGESGG